jgi:hypothetical protein
MVNRWDCKAGILSYLNYSGIILGTLMKTCEDINTDITVFYIK